MTNTTTPETQSAFIEELASLMPAVRGYLIIKTRNIAFSEDLAHEVFLKAHKNIAEGKYNEEGYMNAWLTRIASNLLIDRRRKQKKLNTAPMSHSEDFERAAHNAARELPKTLTIYKKNDSEIWDYISNILPKEQFNVLEMRLRQDMPFNKIATKENIPLNTSLGRMRYALINLRKHPEVSLFLNGDIAELKTSDKRKVKRSLKLNLKNISKIFETATDLNSRRAFVLQNLGYSANEIEHHLGLNRVQLERSLQKIRDVIKENFPTSDGLTLHGHGKTDTRSDTLILIAMIEIYAEKYGFISKTDRIQALENIKNSTVISIDNASIPIGVRKVTPATGLNL